ncbi:sulfite exporter TauE/SafE family protein [Falsiroseomonas tokyonensis]|uniref:Probable membrane transporter protein n=1 Tax=Falsiroseomonas tokyonensis TaxID=430521 RepID=A0ABV7C0X2_9PROT|nr:sulfite exporter TauE/SafE family protein [Falsiroseomonas tokyonensis]MBU8541337.1 sulfite exporter TauE/SafE family protein [Falsiroseomonas tokyonensis]
MDLQTLAVIGLVFLIAGAAKGLIGLGLPTIAIGLLALAMPPAEAAGLLLLPSLVTNILQASGPGWRDLLRRLWPMLLLLVPGTLAGIGLLTGGGALALGLLGLALAAYGGWGLLAPPVALSPRMERLSAAPIGLAGGLVTGATGVFVMPVVPWLGALGLPRDALVQALGLSFLVATLALGLALAWQGSFTPISAGASLLALPPTLAGLALGSRLRGLIPPPLFRRIFFGSLLALGAHLAIRGLA